MNNNLPLFGEYDVVVCGAGPAGIGAALGAAYQGAKTILIERRASLGGITTGAFIAGWADTPAGPVMNKLIKKLKDLDAGEYNFDPERFEPPGRFRLDGEIFKAVVARLVKDAGVQVLLDTIVEGTLIDNDSVKGIYIANKDGRTLVKAKVVIDATGDGDVAAAAGAEFMKGAEDDGHLQHVNYKFQISGVKKGTDPSATMQADELEKKVRDALKNGEIRPPGGVCRPEAETFPFSSKTKNLIIGKWEIAGVDCSSAKEVSNTILDCQAAALDVVKFCRKHIPGYEKCRIERFPETLGTRESRRITGKYILTKDDVINGQKFEDGVARGSFMIDLHDSSGPHALSNYPNYRFPKEYVWKNRPPKGDWYEIPYRCLVPLKIKGLLVCGRCISCTREALGSMRVQPTCMFTGSAAGIAAAICVKKDLLPDELDGNVVKKEIYFMEEK